MLRTSLVVLLLSASVFAYCPRPEPLICGEYFRHEAIFTGTVISETWMKEYGDPHAAREYQLKVQHMYKGAAAKVITIYVRNDSTRFPDDLWKSYQGRDVLVFANTFRGKLWMDSCSKSGFVSQSSATINELEAFSRGNKNGGRVTGEIVVKGTAGAASSARVAVRSKSQPGAGYRGTTDEHGRFSIFVPAGDYIVSAETAGHIVSVSDLSRDNPLALRIEDGQCGQVFFVATPSP